MKLSHPSVASPRGYLRLEELESRLLPSGFQPTALDQLFLERLNDARANPAAYGASIGLDLSSVAPSQPLAFDPRLIQAATGHSQDMSANGYYGHTGSDGSSPSQRIAAAGYPWDAWGESVAAGYASPEEALKALIIDTGEPGLVHRHHLLAMDPIFQPDSAVGIGIVQNGGGPYLTYYTIDSGATADTRPYLTGVVFADNNHNNAYEVGEGLGGVTITVDGVGSTTTFDSGGYSIQLDPGTYTVTASGGGLATPITEAVTIGSKNYRLNFNALQSSMPVLAPIADQLIAPGQGSIAIPLSIANADVNAVSVSARAGNLDGLLKETLGLSSSGDYFQNWGGLNEKWLQGNGGQWYYLLPDGRLYHWENNDTARNPLVATLDTDHWADPTLLTGADPGASPATVSTDGGRLLVTPTAGFVGTFGVIVTVQNGAGVDTKFFTVTVPDLTPQLANLPGQTPSGTSDSTVSAAQAFAVKQALGLTSTGNTYTNWSGADEKWMSGSGGQWYFILPNGGLYRWNGRQTASTLVAALGATYYQDPSLLFNAQPTGA